MSITYSSCPNVLTCFKGLAKDFVIRAKIFSTSFAGKTRRNVEPAAVRGGDVDVFGLILRRTSFSFLGWFRNKSLNKEASTWG